MKKLKSIAALAVLGLTHFSIASAQRYRGLENPPQPGGLLDLSNGDGVAGILGFAINFILLITGSIAVLFIIVGGFQFILSGANEDLAKRGKTTLKNAILGLIIIVLSYTIVRIIFVQLTTRG